MLKKHFVSILLLVFCLLTQSDAWAISSAALGRKVTAAEQSQRRKSTTRKKKSTRATSTKQTSKSNANANTWYGLPIISWQQFEQANEQIMQRNEEFFKLDKQAQESLSAETIMASISVKQGRPNYAEFVQNVHYIYIGEAHDEPIIEKEIQHLLSVIREANPGKKILLATEFALVTHPLINPLHRAENVDFFSYLYNWIPELIQSLSMDTLALDDQIVQTFDPQSTSTPLLKVGNKYVRHDGKGVSTDNILINYAKEIQKNVEQALSSMDTQALLATDSLLRPDEFNKIYSLYKKEAPEWVAGVEKDLDPGNGVWNIVYSHVADLLKEGTHLSPLFLTHLFSLAQVNEMLQYSSWGIKQRNEQWAKRIKNVESNYDIVIIWAGEGHFEGVAPADLPYLISSSDAMWFDFSALNSHMEDDLALAYAKRRTDLTSNPAEAKLPEGLPEELLKLGIDFSQTYYIEAKNIPHDKETEKKKAKLMGKEQFPNLPLRMISVALE